jgi:dTDP-4-dehydrorhamnose reductase
MKILICGGRGQLGHDCTEVLEKGHEVVSVDLEELDISERAAVEETIGRVRPDIVLNCAAYTRVDDCETEKALARRVNVEGPKNLARAAGQAGARLIHISTDYVFDGKRTCPDPYGEEDRTGPLCYYGITKLEAEEAVRNTAGRHMILRTAWLYGFRGNNFLKTILRLALGDPDRVLSVVNDQFGSPTWAYRLALQIEKLIEFNGRGIYHATSEGYCSWYELAGYFLAAMGVPHTLSPCETAGYPTPAVRPGNSILDNRRLREAGVNVMVPWKDDLNRFISMFRDRLIREAHGSA